MIQSIAEPKGDEFFTLTKILVKETEYDFWDDGFGPVWAYEETMGIVGFVRADSWEEAWDCLVDEIMSDALPFDEWDEDEKAAFQKDGTLPEGCYHRGSGVPSNKKLTESIAQTDLNGHGLEKVTEAYAERHDIKIFWSDE